MNTDGVFRLYSTINYTIKYALPMVPDEIADAIEAFARNDNVVLDLFAGIDGTKVPIENLMHPPNGYINEFKEAMAKIQAYKTSLSPATEVRQALRGKTRNACGLFCISLLRFLGLH